MTDKAGAQHSRPPQQRLKTLAQAALNADVTVGQVDALLDNLTEMLSHLGRSTDAIDETMVRFNSTIKHIDELAPRLIVMIEQMEAIVDRVERLVGLGEAVVSPLSATEHAVRGVVNALRGRAGV